MTVRPRGAMPDWQPRNQRTKAVLADLIAAYEAHRAAGTLPRGPRGIFYDLRPNGHGHGMTYYKIDAAHPAKSFGPMEAHEEIVRETLLKARRAGIIPEYWVADGRAQSPIGNYYDESAAECVGATVGLVRRAEENFELDPQRGQPIYVEVLCEAADLAPRLARVANPYGVTVYMGSGFDGLKAKRAMGERAAERDRPTVVLHVADRDYDGDRIYVAAGEDVVAWCGEGEVGAKHTAVTRTGMLALRRALTDHRPRLRFHRLGLTPAQASALSVLDADGKAEADAVPVPVMDGWLTDAIEALQDPAHAGMRSKPSRSRIVKASSPVCWTSYTVRRSGKESTEVERGPIRARAASYLGERSDDTPQATRRIRSA
jgi:hypothetical protein